MMPSLTIRRATALALAAVLAGCGAGMSPSPQASSAPSMSTELRFYNWDEYIDPDVVTAFETEYGIEVTIDTFSDETEMSAVIAGDPSRYDVFIASDYLVGEMAAQRLLAELDHTKIPNLGNIDPRYLDLPSDPGNRVSAPYDWGTTGVVYNTTCIEPAEPSWAILADPRVAGRASTDSDPRTALGTTLRYLGHPLGSRDPGDLAEAAAYVGRLLTQQGVQVLNWEDLYDGMLSGELCAGVAFNGDASYLMGENDQLDFFIPQEGSDYYLDALVIPRDAANKPGAELFINFLLRPDIHAANTAFTGYGNPNRAAVDAGLIDADVLADPVIYPPLDNLEPWPVFDASTRALWNRAWADVEKAVAGTAQP